MSAKNVFNINNGVVTEGYLNDKRNFNGVLFLLREPNSKDQTSFWFKDCLDGHGPDDTTSKKQFKKYKNTFEKLLKYVGDDINLEECIYANVLSQSGESAVSKTYKELSDKDKVKRFIGLIETCGATHVFVCNDMFNALVNEGIIKEQHDGVVYKCRQKRSSRCFYNDKYVDIYEINHPSYRGCYPE